MHQYSQSYVTLSTLLLLLLLLLRLRLVGTTSATPEGCLSMVLVTKIDRMTNALYILRLNWVEDRLGGRGVGVGGGAVIDSITLDCDLGSQAGTHDSGLCFR